MNILLPEFPKAKEAKKTNSNNVETTIAT